MARLKLGARSIAGGATVFFSIRLNALPFGSLLTGAKRNACIRLFVDLTRLLKDACGARRELFELFIENHPFFHIFYKGFFGHMVLYIFNI